VDIHTIATPSFDGLPLEAYSFPRTLPIVFSRGCPAKCTFCFETVMWQRFRMRTVESVIDEIQLRLRTYGPMSFRFNDSLLNGDIAWLERFADAVLEAGLQIKWHGNARIHPGMTPLLLDKLAAAGLTGLLYGVESGSQKILQRMKKGVHAPTIPRVLADTHRAGIWTHAFMILDFPGEGDKELLETLDLLADQVGHIDSLVFHDFHLPPELVEYLNFTGRVPVDEGDVPIDDPALPYQSNAAALRPFVDVFLENFLHFAHAHGNVHSMPIAAADVRWLLRVHRDRWLGSAEFGRARIALLAFRALIMKLAELGLTALAKPEDANLHALRDRKILSRQPADPIERQLAGLAYASRDTLRSAIATIQTQFPSSDAILSGNELLDLLFDALPTNNLEEQDPSHHSERFVPEGWR
jgi:pyruvate-formate lyase-activating enzyme